MRLLLKIIVLFFCVLMMLPSSCKKYPDGPSFSLLTKKYRLTGNWTLATYLKNDTDYTLYYRQYEVNSENVSFKKNGDYQYIFVPAIVGGQTTVNGTWQFTSKKNDLEIHVTSGAPVSTTDYEILRLENKALWLKTTSGNNTYEYHYVAL